MANRSKQKGTAFESDVVGFINIVAPRLRARRNVLHGSKDIGDIDTENQKWALELKNCAKMELAQWVEEARKEAANADRPWFAVIHKRRMKRAGDSFVTMPLHVFIDVLEKT